MMFLMTWSQDHTALFPAGAERGEWSTGDIGAWFGEYDRMQGEGAMIGLPPVARGALGGPSNRWRDYHNCGEPVNSYLSTYREDPYLRAQTYGNNYEDNVNGPTGHYRPSTGNVDPMTGRILDWPITPQQYWRMNGQMDYMPAMELMW
jgi:hypothetical protein